MKLKGQTNRQEHVTRCAPRKEIRGIEDTEREEESSKEIVSGRSSVLPLLSQKEEERTGQ